MRPPGASQRASTTLVALCFSAVLAIALSSYLTLCYRSYHLSTRQLRLDQARQLAHTGLEEALWALNQNNWSASGPAGTATWAVSGTSRTVALAYPALGPGASGAVNLTVANYAAAGPTWPTITSSATITLDDGQSFTKVLQAAVAPAPLFGNAIASANAYVSFVSGGTVDSWNSDPDGNPATPAVAYSFTAGNSANYAAVVAGNDNGTYGVVINQAQVYGYVATFGEPVSASSSGTPPGRVRGPATPALVNVDPARVGRSAFIPVAPVFAITLPSTAGANYGGLLGSVLDLVTALLGAPLTKDLYQINGNLTINGTPLVAPSLTVDRPLNLIVQGDLVIGSAGLFTGKITVTPTGALQVFVLGDVTIGGNGIDNQTQDPRKVAIFCKDNSTANSLRYTTTAGFCGVIYCENKPIDIRENATFHGALLSSQYVRFSTNATAPVFHYDTALRRVRFSGVATPYVLDRVTEP